MEILLFPVNCNNPMSFTSKSVQHLLQRTILETNRDPLL